MERGVIDFEARADPKADGVSWRKRKRRGGKEREREPENEREHLLACFR